MTSHKAVITDEKGTEIPYYEEVKGDDLYLFPKTILKGYYRYTVSLEYQVEDSADTPRKYGRSQPEKGMF
ncbi:hypothetical protein D3C80_2077950 [compost metagenome]